MVVVSMKGIGQIVDEGTYNVVLTAVSEKKTQKGDDMVTFKATIKDPESEMNGRSLFRNFVISSDPDKDNSGLLYYLQRCLVAFGAEEEDVTSETLDPVKVGKTLYGNNATAKVVHVPDNREGKEGEMQAQVEFMEPDF